VTESFRAVIVGGGVCGTSIAYHLAEAGWRDVLLVDRSELTWGSTFHSAGFVGQLRSTVNLTRMMMDSVALYRRLRDEQGLPWHEVGSLRLASSPERRQELTRLRDWAETFGLPLELVSTDRALELFPFFDPEGVEGAAHIPTDGYLDPSELALALARGATARGVTIRTGVRVLGIDVRDGRVHAVSTDAGTIDVDVVVNAGGIWAHDIGRLAGVNVPVVPLAHEYLRTHPIEGVDEDLCTMRDPDLLIYLRPHEGGLVMGGYQPDVASWGMDGIPQDFNHRLLPPDPERFAVVMDNARRRIPALRDDSTTSELVCGPEAFTPDGEFVLGESADVRGFFVAAGFCAHGIAGAGGVGKLMGRWIVEGDPGMNVWEMDVRRFGRQYRSRPYTLARSTEIYASYYAIRYPNHEREAGRPLRVSAAYDRLRELGASFGEKAGWERANWFEPNSDPALEAWRPNGWAGVHWSSAIAAEALACRRHAAMFDESSFAKIEVAGQDAAEFLQRLCANDVDREPGSVVYTQLLNARGGIECDLTVTRLGPERFLLVTGTAFGAHDLAWVQGHVRGDERVDVRDVTGAGATFGVWGPAARDILQPLADDDLSDEAFPFFTARDVTVGWAPCLALRVTYVGELGWELSTSPEYGRTLWDSLLEAGRSHGLVPAGYRALDALRLEKGYRVWGSDITPDDSPFEAGLGFAVRMDLPGFVGNEASERRQAEGIHRQLACLVLDDVRSVALGNEPVSHDGVTLGRVTSGGIGFAVERSIAYAYLPIDLAKEGTPVHVRVFGEDVGATVAHAPLWDPTNSRIRS
jgi:glycine cleavage system T protein